MTEGKTTIKPSEILLLHSRADRSLRALVSDQLDDEDITMMEWLLLDIIQSGPKDGLSMSSIAEQLSVTLPQVTALMTGVAKKRLVRQKTQRRDRRSRHALLTEKGRRVLESAETNIAAAMNKWMSSLSMESKNLYPKILEKLAQDGGRHDKS
jgi:DNA-binding MarR family transcriptional regulator